MQLYYQRTLFNFFLNLKFYIKKLFLHNIWKYKSIPLLNSEKYLNIKINTAQNIYSCAVCDPALRRIFYIQNLNLRKNAALKTAHWHITSMRGEWPGASPVARPTGLEPATNGIGIRYSIQIELRANINREQGSAPWFFLFKIISRILLCDFHVLY